MSETQKPKVKIEKTEKPKITLPKPNVLPATETLRDKTIVPPAPQEEEPIRLDKRGHPIGGRGRPRKRPKPPMKMENYTDNWVATLINEALRTTLNNTILKHTAKLEAQDVTLGEALCYTLDYYGIENVEHPIIAIVMSLGSLGLKIYEKTHTQPETTPKTEEKPNEV